MASRINHRIAIAVLVLSTAPVLVGQEGTLAVRRISDRFIIRYQDPDHEPPSRELVVPFANSLFAAVTPTIEPLDGAWRYDYSVTNSSESQQSLVSWSVQVGYGSTALDPSSSWTHELSPLSLLTWTAGPSEGVVPRGTQSGFSVVSDQLPTVRTVAVRGIHALNSQLLDIPAFVRAKVVELERDNVVQLKTIGPGIPIKPIARGSSGLLSPLSILEEIKSRYVAPLREIGDSAQPTKLIRNQAEYDRRLEGTSTGALITAIDEAVLALRNQDVNLASIKLDVAITLLRNWPQGDDWTTTVNYGLKIALMYVRTRAQSSP